MHLILAGSLELRPRKDAMDKNPHAHSFTLHKFEELCFLYARKTNTSQLNQALCSYYQSCPNTFIVTRYKDEHMVFPYRQYGIYF